MNQEYDWLDEILETSEYWLKLKNETSALKTTILNPDGWDKLNLPYSFFQERISHQEFNNRINNSTCRFFINKINN